MPLLPARLHTSTGGKQAKSIANPSVAVVYFSTPSAECIDRVASRTDHPTIKFGRGRPAIESMAKALELPLAVAASISARSDGAASEDGRGVSIDAEGMRWTVVRTPAEANALLARWGAPPAEAATPGMFKFPRTHHVLNTGGSAVTRDDLVMDAGEASRFFDGRTVVTADEKPTSVSHSLKTTRYSHKVERTT